MNILVIGTLDTKLVEVSHLAGRIEAQGASAVVMDASTRAGLQPPVTGFRLVSRRSVAEAAGTTIEAIASLERGAAVSAMRAGVAKLTVEMARRGEIHGAVCIGGAGAHLAGPAFQALDIGFPKLIVSPLASGHRTFEPYVGLRDVAVLHSVADIAGINVVTSKIYRETAGYIVGAARAQAGGDRAAGLLPAIAVSMNGNTTPGLTRAMAHLERNGFACVSFHANGTGGRALEDFVAEGNAVGVLDFTTTELSAHLVGGLMDPGPSRMEAAGAAGIPQMLVPGCVDFITCGRWNDTERQFPGRRLYGHNPELTLVRLTADEMREVGRTFARKANQAVGPTEVFVPARGFSVPDAECGPFWDPAADGEFIAALKRGLDPKVRLEIVDAHINDDAFVDGVTAALAAAVAAAMPIDAESRVAEN